VFQGVEEASKTSDLKEILAKYSYCYAVYERCASQIGEQIAIFETQNRPTPQYVAPSSSGCRLPPCETEVFHGDYSRWPTFRDLFTAIYINNPRLTPVEKLFHLNSKTSGEANDIVSRSPLTNDGFESAWRNLTQRFENKRLLVTNQLEILFGLSSISQECGAALKGLQSTVQGCLNALKLANVQTENWDCFLVYMCSLKLPTLTLSLWEQSLQNKAEVPTWDEFNSFLLDRYRTLEAIAAIKANSSAQSQAKPVGKESSARRLKSFESRVNTNPQSCKLCSKENHPIRLCPSFLHMSVNERSSYIKKQKLCLNCFARGHQLKDCTSAHNCYTCKGRHNTLLHRGSPPQSTSGASSSSSNTPNIQSASSSIPNVQSYMAASVQGVLLGTAMVNICHQGASYKARALIDSGSEASFISERMFRLIKLPYQHVQAQVSGLNQAVAATPKKLCHFNIGSPSKPRLQIETSAFVLPQLAGNLPSYPIPQSFLRDLPNIQLADPSFHLSSQIDVLIGADILPSILIGGSRSNICGSLLGQETIFGWILTGPVVKSSAKSISSFSTRITVSPAQRLENLLTKFWEVEDLPVKLVKESDSICEENFVRTTRRNSSGRYVVTLPFVTPDHISLGHSRSIALAQFLKNENRLKRNIPLKEQYDSVIQE